MIKSQIEQSILVKKLILEDEIYINKIELIANKCLEAYRNGKKTIFAGNGGSAADSQHLSAEFVSRFNFNRPALASLALTTDTSILTSIGNDYGFEYLFSRQIEANGVEGDVFIAISTSGNSINLLNAINSAKKKNIITVALTGASGDQMANLCDYSIKVPSIQTPRIQESHILIGHIICSFVEESLFGSLKK
jgi:D-sedoheptulose 7-phosphate isomerase